MRYEVEYYKKEDGTEPAKEFILTQDRATKAKIETYIGMLREIGPAMREPRSKLLREGIFEIRVRVNKNISRVLYFFVKGQKIILTNGFVKKTQKTPTQEIERAKRYREDYLKRKVD